jgi:small conductance mechanosensitive channel
LIPPFIAQTAATAPPVTAQSGGLSVVWTTLIDMGRGFLSRVPYIGIALIILLLFLVAARLTRRAIRFAGERTALDVTLADLLGRLAGLAIHILGILVAAVIVFPGFRPGDLVTGLGITSVVLGFAFKDILQNFVAGILLLWHRPFRAGDQIRSGEFEGTVEEVTIRSTRIRTFDGERAVIPNSVVYTNAVLVKTAYDWRRVRLTIGVGYSDSIADARETIQKALKGIEGVMEDPRPCVYATEFAPSSVNFVVYFWTASDQSNVLRVSDQVATGIKLALDSAGITMPYPHTVVVLRDETDRHPQDSATP